MNLHPPKLFEKVTIVMAPLEQYSVFPKAIDHLYKNTHHPFDLIVIEGNAPDSVRHAIEQRKKHHENIRIIYTSHAPRMPEAYNLSLVHIRTKYAFFMHNNIRVSNGWLTSLLRVAGGRNGVVCPYFSREMSENLLDIDFIYPVSYDYFHAHKKDVHGINQHGFLISRDTLTEIGEFDEDICTLLTSVDFNMRAKAKNVDVWMDPQTLLDYENPMAFRAADQRLFQRQWNREYARTTFDRLMAKWGLRFDETKYMAWLEKKLVSFSKRPSLASHPAFKPQTEKFGLKKLIRGFARV